VEAVDFQLLSVAFHAPLELMPKDDKELFNCMYRIAFQKNKFVNS
jgi:hypothetical protein